MMYLLAVSLVLLALKYFEVAPFAAMSWWWMLVPFALTASWWFWSDSSGYTKRKAQEKMDQRRQERLDKHKRALAPEPRKPRWGAAGGRCRGWRSRLACRLCAMKNARSDEVAAGVFAMTVSARPYAPSTAPWLALDALKANLACTPRV